MNETGPEPDAKTYLTVLSTLKRSERWEEAIITIRQMRRALPPTRSATLSQIYTTVLQLMLESKKPREALEVRECV
jgi:hypothetical protein